MEKIAAQKLVQETLEDSFDKDRFVYLVRNILNHIEEAPFTYQGNYIFDDFADSIRSAERIGKYQDSDERLIDILIINLKKETSLERARTMQRNFVAKYLNGSRGGELKDAALVAFVAPNGDDWRFSFVKMEYRFDEQGKVKEEFTPPAATLFWLVKTNTATQRKVVFCPFCVMTMKTLRLYNSKKPSALSESPRNFLNSTAICFCDSRNRSMQS